METTIYILALLPLSFASLACQFLAIIDLFTRDKRELWGGNLLLWSLFILLGSLIGALVYLAVGRKTSLITQGEQV